MATATVNPAVAPAARIFLLNDDLVLQALDGLTQEELWRAPTDHNNALLWVAGHVVQTRATILQILGEAVDTGWGNLFDRGAKVGDPKLYPSGKEIEGMMRRLASRLQAALASASEDWLNQPASLGIPGFETLGDELAFWALHDSYHVGQMAYIRKGLGYPNMVG
jgi:uncharacterized damage-inducible protein DinB